MMMGLKIYLEHRPWAYQDEIILYLFDDWKILCSQPTISRALKEHRISRKIIQKEALERSQLARNNYMLEISELSNPQNQICYLDESVANEHACHRKHGWSPYGVTPRAILPVKRSERHSVLPVYTINGILTYHIHQGGIDGPRFEWFLANEVLPLCNPYPGPRFVLIMDNESVHIHPVSLELVLYRLSAN